MPSVKQILFDRFGVKAFSPWTLRRVGGKTIELDALGIVNGERNERISWKSRAAFVTKP
jgi:hypothetical protein